MLKGGGTTSLFSCQLRFFYTDLLRIHLDVVAGIRLILAVIHRKEFLTFLAYF